MRECSLLSFHKPPPSLLLDAREIKPIYLYLKTRLMHTLNVDFFLREFAYIGLPFQLYTSIPILITFFFFSFFVTQPIFLWKDHLTTSLDLFKVGNWFLSVEISNVSPIDENMLQNLSLHLENPDYSTVCKWKRCVELRAF